MSQEPCSGLWRSEDMVLQQLHMQREAAHDTILKLGQLGCVQFRDMNVGLSAYQRLFTNDVRRCEDAERRLRYFESQLIRQRDSATGALPVISSSLGGPAETLDTLEPKLESMEAELRELNSKWEQLLSGKNAMKEHYEILTQPPSFFRGDSAVVSMSTGDEEAGATAFRAGGLRYLTGVVASDRAALFERLVYRATRGNMFMRTVPAKEPFEDPATGWLVDKTVFVVFFSAQRAHDKIKKLCESSQATLYPYNIDNPQDVFDTCTRVEDNLRDLETTIKGTEDIRFDILEKIRQNLYPWKKTVIVEKSVYNILNQLSFKGQTVVAECWTPKADLDKVQEALSDAERTSGAQVQSFMEQLETKEAPPTYFRTNGFTGTHQGIVDSYGIARYKEINPAVFSCVTFPFLFGIMYGDVGHGVILTLVAAIFIWKEKQLQAMNMNEIIEIVFGGRYIIILMGVFAVYVGFLYNDFFGMVIKLAPSNWEFPTSPEEAAKVCSPGYVVWNGVNAGVNTGGVHGGLRGCVSAHAGTYPFGVDPSWGETANKLDFYNSLKMKMAVILGVGQMVFGLILALFNHIYFNDMKHVWFGFIPEVVLLMSTFGYMDFMIIVKWCTDWPARFQVIGKGDNYMTAPSLLEGMTDFFLNPTGIVAAADLDQSNPIMKWLYGDSPQLQQYTQIFLVLCFLIAIPSLLIPIPIIEYNHAKGTHYGELTEDETPAEGAQGEESEEPAFDMSEVVIKQVIHTIEFVLGAVSNTASYLRLWALSLAHAQLSEVFWNFAWMTPLSMDKGTGLFAFLGFGVWFAATVGVLLIMESLSAFLHALRLHWVEFQNKFYMGDGHQFVPYDYLTLVPRPQDILKTEE